MFVDAGIYVVTTHRYNGDAMPVCNVMCFCSGGALRRRGSDAGAMRWRRGRDLRPRRATHYCYKN